MTILAQALMSSFFWLPPGSCAAQLVPELLRSILQGVSVDERLSPRAKAAVIQEERGKLWKFEILCN